MSIGREGGGYQRRSRARTTAMPEKSKAKGINFQKFKKKYQKVPCLKNQELPKRSPGI